MILAGPKETSVLTIAAGQRTRSLVQNLLRYLGTLRDQVKVEWGKEGTAVISLHSRDSSSLIQAIERLLESGEAPAALIDLFPQGFPQTAWAAFAKLEEAHRNLRVYPVAMSPPPQGGTFEVMDLQELEELSKAVISSRGGVPRASDIRVPYDELGSPSPLLPSPPPPPPPLMSSPPSERAIPIASEPSPADPPRQAYGLLQCPETAVAGEEMELTVGLAREAPAGVAGPPLERPETSVGPYTMTIQVIAEGFALREGESFRQTLPVTAEAPYPTFTLHLTADRQTVAKQKREIHASYTVDGQPLGFAVRYLTVVRKAGAASAESATASGVNVQVPAATRAADLTAVIRRQTGSASTLLWTFESPHPLNLPDKAIPIEIGSAPQDFARRLMNEVNKSQGQEGTYELLIGHGLEIQQHMPSEFWDLLRAANAATPGLPTVLFLSQDPFIPWELAVLDEPLFDAEAAPFLGAQAVVGRWVQPGDRQTRPRLPPPAELEVGRMSFVTGVYSGATAPRRLKEAEAEVEELQTEFSQDGPADRVTKVDAKLGEVLACLRDDPGADLLHFSLHGRFDPSGLEDGLLLIDNKWLMPAQVKGTNLRRGPFVFLNACQVGQGNDVLGVYAGMAEAFLFAGASAVVAPLWSVDDKVAHDIALSFYQATLRDGSDTPAAEVLRRERAKFTRGEQAATYLSYQFFGHPEMRLRLRK
jgi:hypothetical protein